MKPTYFNSKLITLRFLLMCEHVLWHAKNSEYIKLQSHSFFTLDKPLWYISLFKMHIFEIDFDFVKILYNGHITSIKMLYFILLLNNYWYCYSFLSFFVTLHHDCAGGVSFKIKDKILSKYDKNYDIVNLNE